MDLKKTKNNRFYFTVRKESPNEKRVYLITKNELDKFNKLGSSAGDLGLCLAMGSKYCENFLDRLYAFSVKNDEEFISLDEILEDGNKDILDTFEIELKGASTYTFYEKKENSPDFD